MASGIKDAQKIASRALGGATREGAGRVALAVRLGATIGKAKNISVFGLAAAIPYLPALACYAVAIKLIFVTAATGAGTTDSAGAAAIGIGLLAYGAFVLAAFVLPASPISIIVRVGTFLLPSLLLVAIAVMWPSNPSDADHSGPVVFGVIGLLLGGIGIIVASTQTEELAPPEKQTTVGNSKLTTPQEAARYGILKAGRRRS